MSTTRPTVTETSWRIDVVLSSNTLRSLRHNAQPIAVVNMALSDGRIIALRLKPEDVHQWRHILARSVKDLTYLDRQRPSAPVSKKIGVKK